MIIPDINLLLYAYNADSTRHPAARVWWTKMLRGQEPIGLCWVVILGFIRIATGRALPQPMPVPVAVQTVRAWLDQPAVVLISPGSRHAAILFRLLESLGTAGNLTTDAHLAALAIEYQAEVHSSDADFARFPGLRWTNPFQT